MYMAIPSLSTSSAPVGETRRKPAINGETREALAAYLFLIPYLFVLLVFFIVAGVYGIGLSLFKVDIGFTSPEFIGLRNYQNLFQQLSYFSDSDFWTSMVVILKF